MSCHGSEQWGVYGCDNRVMGDLLIDFSSLKGIVCMLFAILLRHKGVIVCDIRCNLVETGS